MSKALYLLVIALAILGVRSGEDCTANEDGSKSCGCDGSSGLPDHATVRAALSGVVSEQNNGGFGLHMWATVVNRDGFVKVVAFSGEDRGD